MEIKARPQNKIWWIMGQDKRSLGIIFVASIFVQKSYYAIGWRDESLNEDMNVQKLKDSGLRFRVDEFTFLMEIVNGIAKEDFKNRFHGGNNRLHKGKI